MKDLVAFIVTSLVDNPDQVRVGQRQHGSEVQIQVKVAKDDMGRVIGKNGRVANAIRMILNVAAAQKGKRISMDIEEPEE